MFDLRELANRSRRCRRTCPDLDVHLADVALLVLLHRRRFPATYLTTKRSRHRNFAQHYLQKLRYRLPSWCYRYDLWCFRTFLIPSSLIGSTRTIRELTIFPQNFLLIAFFTFFPFSSSLAAHGGSSSWSQMGDVLCGHPHGSLSLPLLGR